MNVRDFGWENKKHISLRAGKFCSKQFNVNPEKIQLIF